MTLPSPHPEKLLILDFDGVVNATASSLPTQLQYRYEAVDIEAHYTPGNYRIQYSPDLVRDLNHLSQHVNIVYLSTWEKDTNLFPAHLGMYDFPHLTLGTEKLVKFEHPFTTLKGNALRAHLASNPQYLKRTSTVVWVDDQITPREKTWALENGITPITPNPVLGLLKNQVKNIYEEFDITYPFA